MSRLIFVNRFYWPEEPATSQLLTDLAQALASGSDSPPACRDVTIVTSRRAPLPRRETRAGVNIRRVGPIRRDSRSLLARALDLACFTAAALLHLARHTRRGDTVILLTDPPLLGALATPLLRLRRAHIIHWVQDIYPEIAIELSGQGWLRALRPLRDAAWRKAHACVTLGPDMAAVLHAARVPPQRIHSIPNWALPELCEAPAAETAALKKTWGLADKFVVLYSGNLGRVHDLPPILDIAAALLDEPQIVFAFVGRGAQQAPLRAIAQARRLTNIHFLPPVPRAQLSTSLSTGDLHLVTLKSGCESYVLPSKLYGIAAVSRPLLFIGPRRASLFSEIPAADIGLSFTRDETAAAATAILELAQAAPERRQAMRLSVRAFSEKHAFAHALAAWRTLLAEVDGSAPTALPSAPAPAPADIGEKQNSAQQHLGQ
ncbi:hypothetical protein AXK11_04245 [Cephaloticoccus primus]|uniref:Glycosyltransferase subfamily 4-like N-terminal domain-containing protein n=1 Tax=Cephaloticoccus primus TaxID=1548207 RepID=A0A139SPS6_9BACT|nr:glycosyltransferase family 4 protein [Cephaloticoccus primus]KXU36567.1 hypothetical protein AXK11_04245 [Cephaloticoccus primus]